MSIYLVPGDHRSMMHSGNIEQLADAFTAALRSAVGKDISHPETAYWPKVVLQAGQPGFEPILVIPGAGGSVTAFYELALQLDKRIPILGLQPRGLDGRLAPYFDVETAAAAYMEAIREHQPHGPYRLIGHSFGGWIAFEIARRLRAGGSEVAMLLLLDSRSPSTLPAGSSPLSHERVLLELVRLYEMSSGCNLNIGFEDLCSRNRDEQVDLLLARLVRAGVLPSQTDRKVVEAIVRVFETNFNTRYRPEGKYPGKIDLVYACEPAQYHQDPLAHADLHGDRWAALSASAERILVSANHMTLLRAPENQAVAEHIMRCYHADELTSPELMSLASLNSLK